MAAHARSTTKRNNKLYFDVEKIFFAACYGSCYVELMQLKDEEYEVGVLYRNSRCAGGCWQ